MRLLSPWGVLCTACSRGGVSTGSRRRGCAAAAMVSDSRTVAPHLHSLTRATTHGETENRSYLNNIQMNRERPRRIPKQPSSECAPGGKQTRVL